MNRADMYTYSTAAAQYRVDENLFVFMHKGRAFKVRDTVSAARAIFAYSDGDSFFML